MASVKNLTIKLQTGSDSTYYASWDFDEETNSSTSGGTIKAGDLVSIKSGSTYYNGVSIPSWVMEDQWYVLQVSGDRAVLGENKSKSNNIMSPIKVSNLTLVSGSGSGSGGSSGAVPANTLDHYTVKWSYDTGDGEWFVSSSSDIKEKNSTYSPPANAVKIKVSVKPFSKTYTVNGKETTYWTGSTVVKAYAIASSPPERPSTPSVALDKYKLTASIENISDARTDKIQFQVYNGNSKFSSGTSQVSTRRAAYSCEVKAGGKYRVRCRAVNVYGGSESYSDWSDYSSEVATVPASVTDVKCSADSETSVKLTWTPYATSESYDVEYTKNELYFDRASGVSSMSTTKQTAFITGLETGQKWFFRVRANNSAGSSGWSEIVSTVIGTTPEAPTTWSLTSTVVVGEDVTLYWVHNSEDGSKQTEAQIQLDVNGTVETITAPGIADEDEDEPIYSYTFSTRSYTEGADILWKVRTKGIVSTYSEWSTQRTINLYAPPVLEMTASTSNGTLTTLPLDISATASPATQTPITYHVVITAKNTYESVDFIGSKVLISSGTEMYSKVFNTPDRVFSLSLSAGDILLENGQKYDLEMTVSMDSGLTGTAKETFTVNWSDYTYLPDASISIDKNTLTAYITPYCRDNSDELVSNVSLAVYRREFNGKFTCLGIGLENTGVDTITDPHPSLDYARYRIVAQSLTTGAISFEDLPGQPIGETSIIIQWDEEWTNFDYAEEDSMEIPPWNGSMIRLPYNVDISENHNIDVSLIEYIGREHPVSYYGTQSGETATWNTTIDKKDKETIYALRRLAAWKGNVYIREPSGTGYWANVNVSFPIKHLELTIPVTFDIVRVEGGA